MREGKILVGGLIIVLLLLILIFWKNPLLTYEITASAGIGGKILPGGITRVNVNSSIEYSIVPDEGWKIKEVVVNGEKVGAISDYKFSRIRSGSTIKAKFIGDCSIIIQWDSVEGAAGYKLYYGNKSKKYYKEIEFDAAGLCADVCKYKINSLEPGITYYMALAAVNEGGLKGELSDEIIHTVEPKNK